MLALNPEFKNVGMEVNTGIYVLTNQGFKPYVADVLAERQDGQKFAIEVRHGHKAHKKNTVRDRMLLGHGIITVRMATSDLVGKKMSTEEQMMEEIVWKSKQATVVALI